MHVRTICDPVFTSDPAPFPVFYSVQDFRIRDFSYSGRWCKVYAVARLALTSSPYVQESVYIHQLDAHCNTYSVGTMKLLRLLYCTGWMFVIWGRNPFNCADGKKEKSVVHRISVTGQQDLVFKEGDNPCKVIKKYCKALEPHFQYEQCHSQLHPLVLQQLSALWASVHSQLKVSEGFFIDCETFSFEPTEYTPGISHSEGSTMSSRNSTGIIHELLMLLEQALQRDAAALQTFNVKRNELKLTDIEKVELYRRAILLLPNNLFIVDQFGLALIFIDREALARKLFANAVSRGLWGHPLQRPVSRYVPGLTSLPWHDKRNYPFIARLEEGSADIREEFQYNLRERKHIFTEEQENLHVGGDWTELRLKSSGYGFTKYTEYFPMTMKHIRECGQEFTSIKFSAIQPGTHIRTHTGPSNERLRIHLTLLHTGGARIRVGTEWHTWEEGKAIMFDDSFEHEVIHNGKDIRVVLIMDIWHPELPVDQRVVH